MAVGVYGTVFGAASGGSGPFLNVEDVRLGVDRGDGLLGELVVPSPADVRFGVMVDAPVLTGLAHIPLPEQVLVGINVDQSVGNVVLPAESDVRDGVFYGPNLTDLEGTYIASAIPDSSGNFREWGQNWQRGIRETVDTKPITITIKGTNYQINATPHRENAEISGATRHNVKQEIAGFIITTTDLLNEAISLDDLIIGVPIIYDGAKFELCHHTDKKVTWRWRDPFHKEIILQVTQRSLPGSEA